MYNLVWQQCLPSLKDTNAGTHSFQIEQTTDAAALQEADDWFTRAKANLERGWVFRAWLKDGDRALKTWTNQQFGF